MPSKKQYNLVQNDENDVRIPLHSEEAFHRGIQFNAKFIGSMEVPRPTSRMEIVAAMRRIRYEFKAKGIKKKKVTLEVSVDGLKVTLRKKKFPQLLQKKQNWLDESKLVLMHHPIYRIFYVSHDSHDLKIFSYIARDSTGNSFRCNVFKSSKKSQAMRVVRTVGQAFEVCHKLSLNGPPSNHHNNVGVDEDTSRDYNNEVHRRDNEDEFEDFDSLRQPQPSPSSVHKDISLLGDPEESILDQPCPMTTTMTTCPGSPVRRSPLGNAVQDQLINTELTALKHEIQLVRERLDQQSQQTRAAVAHARLLQDQLAAETAARVEAQARTHQLLVQNKELLEHIAALVNHLREQERLSGQPSNPLLTGLPTLSQTSSNVPDIPSLGQYNSTWDSHPTYPQPPLEAHFYYNPLAYAPRVAISNGYADELRYQKHVWDSIRAGAQPNIPPPPSSLSFHPQPHSHGPGYSLPPTGRPRPPQPPPSSSSTLPRPRTARNQQQTNFRGSTLRTRSLDRNTSAEPLEPTFIKPLPLKLNDFTEPKKPPMTLRNNLYEMMRPLSLNDPPPRRRFTKEVQTDPCYREVAVGNDCPVDDKMPRIEESDSDDSCQGERDDRLAELFRPMRRNSR